MRISEVRSTDLRRWRDDCAGGQGAQYNRSIPVLGSLFKYAEALNLRCKGSNPVEGLLDIVERQRSAIFRRWNIAASAPRCVQQAIATVPVCAPK